MNCRAPSLLGSVRPTVLASAVLPALLLLVVAASPGRAVAAMPAPPVPTAPPTQSAPSLSAEGGKGGSVLRGAPTDKARVVTLEVEDESVRSVLMDLADQAGWDLVLSLPSVVAERELTLRLRARPATLALEAVLRAASLSGEFAGNVLTVRAGSSALKYAAMAEIGRGHGDEAENEAEKEDEQEDEGDVASEARHDAREARREARRAARHGPSGRNDERVSVGQPLTIGVDEVVDSAVAVGAPLLVRGHVLNDAVALGAPLRVAAGARVDGEAVAIGGPIDIEEGARVSGNTLSLGGPVGGITSWALRLARGDVSPRLLLLFSILGVLIRAVAMFVIGLLFLSFAPERVRRTRELLLARPGASVAAGFAILIGILPLVILLAVSVVGIPLIPVALIALAALPALGLTALLTWVGDRLPLWVGRKTQLGAMLLGLALFVLVDCVPVLGWMVLFAAALVASGAAALSRFGSPPKGQVETALVHTP